MKIIFLNAWGGKLKEDISKFMRNEAITTDVFCFQEAYEDFETICAEQLPEYVRLHAYKEFEKPDLYHHFPQATYVVRNSLQIRDSGTLLQDTSDTGLALWTLLQTEKGDLYIANFHGISRPGDKLDTPERIVASQALIAHAENFNCPKIIGGDFNLMSDIESISMFERAGYRDLIKEYKIPTTRNRYSWDKYPGEGKQLFSDYAFVSPDVMVTNFEVPQNEVSDHLPLILEIA